jgi:hypothetical protein
MEKLTRQELFDLVWTTPMTKLAARFGVSDVALAKTCAKYGIPRPGPRSSNGSGRAAYSRPTCRVLARREPLAKHDQEQPDYGDHGEQQEGSRYGVPSARLR